MVDELKQAGEPKELVSELVGQIVKDMTFGRYGKCYSVQVLKMAVEKLRFDVDLSPFCTYISKCGERDL